MEKVFATFFLVILCRIVLTLDEDDGNSLPLCNWAQQYDPNRIIGSKKAQEEIMNAASWWTGKLMKDEFGIFKKFGFARKGDFIFYDTGLQQEVSVNLLLFLLLLLLYIP
jgi:hypothetical protein